MKVLVTGANGLLGHHIVKHLMTMQAEIHIIVRSAKDIFFPLNLVHLTIGNFTDKNDLIKAARGCDAIIHAAAVTSTHLLSYNDYETVNVQACRTLLQVASELQINRIVFVSSVNTIGYGNSEFPGTEINPIKYPFTESFYAQSKMEAENLFIEEALKSDKHIVVVNPAFLVGNNDTKPSSGRLLLMAYNKKIMFVPSGGKNFVSAKHAAEAICEALTRGKSGEKYILGGKNLSFRSFYQLQSEVGGYKQKIYVLPDWILKIAGKAGDMFRFAGIKTDLCSRNLNQLLIQEYYDSNKAEKALGLKKTVLYKDIEKALKWFKQMDYIS